MSELKLDAIVRDRVGTRYTQRLRAAGKTPAVLFGLDQEPSHVAVDSKAFPRSIGRTWPTSSS